MVMAQRYLDGVPTMTGYSTDDALGRSIFASAMGHWTNF